MDQCRATKRDGSRCTLPAGGQQGLCWAHNPANHEKRRRTASRGGKAKATREVRDLKTSIKELIGKVEAGELESTPANTMIRGYSVLLEVIKLERGVYVEEELAARIRELQREGPDAS
jgi:hypothetical protein